MEEEYIRWGGGEDWASCCNTGFEENKPQPPGHVPGCQASDSPELLLVSDHSYSLFSLVWTVDGRLTLCIWIHMDSQTACSLDRVMVNCHLGDKFKTNLTTALQQNPRVVVMSAHFSIIDHLCSHQHLQLLCVHNNHLLIQSDLSLLSNIIKPYLHVVFFETFFSFCCFWQPLWTRGDHPVTSRPSVSAVTPDYRPPSYWPVYWMWK